MFLNAMLTVYQSILCVLVKMALKAGSNANFSCFR